MKRPLIITILIICLTCPAAIHGDHLPDSTASAIALKPSAPTDEIIAHAKHYADQGMYTEQAGLLEGLLREKRNLTSRQQVYVLYTLAYSYYATGVYQRCFNHLFQLLSLEKSKELKEYDCLAHILLADIYARFDNPNKAASMLSLAERDLRSAALNRQQRDNLRQRIHQQWSTVYAMRKEWPQFLSALHMADSLGEHDATDRTRRLLDYGIYYWQTGDTRLASNYFEQIIAQPEWTYDRMAAICNYADLLVEGKQYTRAGEITDLGFSLLEGHRNDEMKASLLRIKARLLANEGDGAAAYRTLEQSIAISDSIDKWHSRHSVLEAARDYEQSLDEAEKQHIIDTHRYRLYQIIGLVVIVLAVILMATWLWIKSKRVASRNRDLEQQLKQQLRSHAEDLTRTREDLSKKQRNIVALTLKMARLNELLGKTVDETNSDDAEMRIKALRAELKSSSINRNVWEIFDLLFEQTDPKFYASLRQRHPDLTRGETRMCAYIMMNLSTKEIAVVTNRSARTVESVKYRLGKKINVPDGMTTADYLRSLSDVT